MRQAAGKFLAVESARIEEEFRHILVFPISSDISISTLQPAP